MQRHDLVILGGGTAGLVAASGAANLGARVVLVEEDRTGGDCLWTGCVPSKALIASAKVAHAARTAAAHGITVGEVTVDFARVMDRVTETQETISHHDSVERFESMGVEVVKARGRFLDAETLEADGRRFTFRSALVATGARPFVPPIDGIDEVEVLTSDTIWKLRELPARMVVIGGGAIGVELGQAFARLGSKVTIVEMVDRLLSKEEPEASEVVTRSLVSEGVGVRTGAKVTSLGRDADGTTVVRLTDARGDHQVPCDAVLMAVGRRPSTADIGLDALGVTTTRSGHVEVDETMRTNVDGIFAAGDVTPRAPFTHVARSDASIVVSNALFGLRRKAPQRLVWTTFTDPEVGRVGMSEQEAREALGDRVQVRTFRHDQLDRAITEGRTEGFTKLVADPKGVLVGATVVGVTAGEQIATIDAWIRQDAKLGTMGAAMVAYPTWAEGTSGASLDHLREQWFTPRTKRLVRPVLGLARFVDRVRS